MVQKFSDRLHRETDTTILDAVSTLKRATGIADNPQRPDSVDGSTFIINVVDSESGRIFDALFRQFMDNGRPSAPGHDVLIKKNSNEDYQLFIVMPSEGRQKKEFLERLDKYVNTLLEPTKRPGPSI